MFKGIMKNKAGFTLVELLAVIVILAIIAAIAVPSVAHIINNTKEDAKVAEAIQIVDASKLYVASNNITDGEVTLNNGKLGPYLDHVNDTSYSVVVAINDTSGDTTYTISKHDANDVLDKTEATEQQLLDYKKK